MCAAAARPRRGGGLPTNEKSGLTIEQHYAHIDGNKSGADCSQRPSQHRRAGKANYSMSNDRYSRVFFIFAKATTFTVRSFGVMNNKYPQMYTGFLIKHETVSV